MQALLACYFPGVGFVEGMTSHRKGPACVSCWSSVCAGVAGSRLEPGSGTALNWETLTTPILHLGSTGRGEPTRREAGYASLYHGTGSWFDRINPQALVINVVAVWNVCDVDRASKPDLFKQFQ